MSLEERKGHGDFLGPGAPQGPSLRYKALPEAGEGGQGSTARGVQGAEEGGAGQGRDVREEQGHGGPRVGILAALGRGGVVWACQVSATAWEEPSPAILIQGRNRTGFSAGSWQCQGAGAGGSQRSGGQWQA